MRTTTYSMGAYDPATDTTYDSVTDLQGWLDAPGHSQGLSGIYPGWYPSVFAGDNVSFMGGFIGVQKNAYPGGGGVYTVGGQWVPDSKYVNLTYMNVSPSGAWDVSNWPKDCAKNPTLSSTKNAIWGAWCQSSGTNKTIGGGGVWIYTVNNVSATMPDGSNILYFEVGSTTPAEIEALSPGLTNFAGPSNSGTGDNYTEPAGATVLNPSLATTKWVCSTGTGCTMPNTKDLADLVSGKAAGVWVPAQLIPQGSTSVQWLITASNTGNVDLADVTVAQDNWGYTDAADKGKATTSDCESLDFGALKAGVSTAKICTMSLSAALDGTLVNGVSLNGTLDNPSQYANLPDGQTVESRLTGNPTTPGGKGVAGVVGSNTAVAQVTEPNPGIKLTKWVCKQGTGCKDPSDADLASLAKGTATPDWVKETTVPYGEDARWLVVVTNTGNTDLKDVALNKDELTNAGSSTLSECAADANGMIQLNSSSLAPGESTFTSACVAKAIKNTASYVKGDPVGSDVVNTATAVGTPVDTIGTIYQPIETLPDTAEVNAAMPPVTPTPQVNPVVTTNPAPGPGPQSITGGSVVGALPFGGAIVLIALGVGLLWRRRMAVR